MELEGKIAFITGGATGIGRATAELFAQEGAEVWIADLDEEIGRRPPTRSRRREARPASCASTSPTLTAWLLPSPRRRRGSGRLDCAVNCAAVTHTGKRLPTAEVDLETFDRIVKVDLRGMFICVQHEIRAMLEHGGSIVNISSVPASSGQAQPLVHRGQARVMGLSKGAGLDYADAGIRVDTLVPV